MPTITVCCSACDRRVDTCATMADAMEVLIAHKVLCTPAWLARWQAGQRRRIPRRRQARRPAAAGGRPHAAHA